MKDFNCWQSKFILCSYSDRLINKIINLNKITKNTIDINEIKKAIYYAKKYHGEQKRDSGEPFYSHPLAVAEMLLDHYCFSAELLVTSILHDVLEDTIITQETLENIFGAKIAENVESLTRIKSYGKISAAKIVELLTLKNKQELLLVKLFDRLHNMQTLGVKSIKKQNKIATETLKNFLPLATYFSWLELEKKIGDLCYEVRSKHFAASDMLDYFDLEENYQLLSQVAQNIK